MINYGTIRLRFNKNNKEETNPIIRHAVSLIQLRNFKAVKNITTGIVDHFCKIGDRDELFQFFTLLKSEKILEPVFFTKFRPYEKLECSYLPSCIANELDEFLSDRFAYTFAIEHLCISLDDSITDPTTPKKLFLQENPKEEFYEQLLSAGIGT